MQMTVQMLRKKLSSILSEVQSGKTFVITKHGKPIARLESIAQHALHNLSCQGAVEWSGKKPVFTCLQYLSDGKSLSQIVLEDR